MPIEPTDDNLILAIREKRLSPTPATRYEGNRLAAALFYRYDRRLTVMAHRICNDSETSISIVGVAFTKALIKYRVGGDFKQYLVSAVRYKAIDWARGHKTRLLTVAPLSEDMLMHWDITESQRQHRLNQRTLDGIYEAIEELPERDRPVVLLWMGGHSWAEIAQHLSRNQLSLQSNFRRQTLSKLGVLLRRRGITGKYDLREV